MSDKFFVGGDLTSAENNGRQLPISRVTLRLDDDNVLTAGDDTGLEIVSDCPYATQAMVDAMLAQVSGHQYQMYSAENANIDPSAELGDGVTVDGIYSVISRIDDDGSGYAGLSAPGEAELEDEYPSAGPMTREFSRKIARTNSRITKTAEQIRLEVEDELDGLSAYIDIKLDSITSQVTGLNGQVSSIKQQADSIALEVRGNSESITAALDLINGFTITDSSGTTYIRGSSIETDSIAANSISADKLNLTGSITFGDLASDAQGQINGAYNAASAAQTAASGAAFDAQAAINTANALANGTGGGTFINGTTVQSPAIIGGTVTGSSLWFGVGGNTGSLMATSGFDGENATEVIELYSMNGLVLGAYMGMRINASKLWIDLDISRVNFRKNGVWWTLQQLLQSAGS